MNQVIIGTAALRAALLSLRTRAEGAEYPAGYYEGGIDMLTALLPEGDAAEARPAIPATSPPIDPRIADAIRFAEDHEACTWCGAVHNVDHMRSCDSGEPTCNACHSSLSATQKQEFPWTLPDSEEAFASLDELLPDAPLATPIAAFYLPKAQALWVVAISEGAKLLWFSFDSEADALAYCADIDPPTGTTAEPSASLGPAPVEEARPADQPEALPPPLLPAAEGDEVPEADHAPPGDLTPATLEATNPAAASAATTPHTTDRLAMFNATWLDGSVSVPTIFARWNALPGPRLKNSTALYNIAKKLKLPTQRPVAPSAPQAADPDPAPQQPATSARLRQVPWRKPETPLPSPNDKMAAPTFDPKSLDPEDNGLGEPRAVTTARGLLGEGYDATYVARLTRLPIDQVRDIAATVTQQEGDAA